MGEVNYFSSKIVVEKNIDSPKIIIPSIGVDEKINNVSLNQGVLSDPGENIPTENPHNPHPSKASNGTGENVVIR